VQDQGDFARFATDAAPGLLRLAGALTGDAVAAERLVEDALVETFRSFPQRGHRSPLVEAHRALVAARPRTRATRSGPSQGLQLHDVSPRAASAPGEADADELLWEAVRDLGERQQLLLMLRCVAGLSGADAAMVLKLPSVVADQVRGHALRELRRTLDVEIAALHAEGHTGVDPAAFDASVCRAIRAHARQPDVDVHQLVNRVSERTSGTLPRAGVPLRLVGAMVIAAFVVTAATSLLVASGLPGHTGHRAAAAPAPSGTRVGSQLVGYRGIAVAVPATWVLHESPCGRTVSPRRVTGTASDLTCAGAPLSTSVTLADPPAIPQPMHTPPARTSSVAGHVSVRTAVDQFDGFYRQTVFVFAARFMMIVRSPDRAVLTAIVHSVRAVPEGYSVVPTCQSLPVREAAGALVAVGLTSSITHASSVPAWYGEPPVIFQSKPPGSIVPAGTLVALTIPGR
jgi:DNA-directed RNA polymerase specialized sigma24 family protein